MKIERLVDRWFRGASRGYRDPFTGEAVSQDEAISRFLSDADLADLGVIMLAHAAGATG